MNQSESVYLLLGSNVGDRERNLSQARARLADLVGIEELQVSPIYLSLAEAMAPDAPPFLNQVIEVGYAYTPLELLTAVERIEVSLGRIEKGERLPRTIDIDILLFGERVVNTPELTIPHPRLSGRAFALAPLLDVNPTLVDPITRVPYSSYFTPAMRRAVALYRDAVTV